MHCKALIISLACALLTFLPGSLGAATYYCSPAGSDANPGTQAQPWQSLQKAAASVAPGDTVVIGDGVYAGPVHLTTPGTAALPIVFKAAGAGAVVHGSGADRDAIYIDGEGLNDPYWLGGDMYVVIQGLTVQNATRAGLRISCAHHVTVRRCLFDHNGTWGILPIFQITRSWKTTSAGIPGPSTAFTSATAAIFR